MSLNPDIVSVLRTMKKPVFHTSVCLGIAIVGLSALNAAQPQEVAAGATTPASRYGLVVRQYCVTCHNEATGAGGVTFDKLDLGNLAANADVCEKAIRKLRNGAMPPQGARQPDRATHDGLTTWLETELDRAVAARPNPGRPLLHRLNRTEYANAIRDLLALEIDAAALLPPDDSSFGFDNIADFLGVSQVLLERYLSAAGRISALAVGDTEVVPGSDTYLVRQDLSQDKHLEGQPFGTVGGVLVRHTFPLDAEYVLQATLYRTNVDQTRGLEHPHDLEITVDGERVFLTSVGGTAPGTPGGADEAAGRARLLSRSDAIDAQLQVRVPVRAGPRAVGVAFLQRSRATDVRKLQPFLRSSADTYDSTGVPHIETLIIKGPYSVTGPGDTPSRQRLFTCRPSTLRRAQGRSELSRETTGSGRPQQAEGRTKGPVAEEPCAKQIISTVARRAYRQPLTDIDLQRLMSFYQAGRADGDFETGIQRALQRILASPKFVLRVERDPDDVVVGGVYRLSDVEVASRLSFFLWSSIPDDELLEAGIQGRLKNPDVLQRQVQRMLADRRADALGRNFAGQWLQLRNLRRVTPDSDLFPDFDDNLRQAFQREVELLFESVMTEDRSVLDLMTADHTFVNERLAKHYKIPNIYGSHFRRVPVPDEARKGLLGKGAVLLVTSNADRTSPVVRGKWILDNLLGTPPPPPIADVPPLNATGEGGKPRTMREQMEEHRRSPVCASCHKLMDPMGLALENFDAVGAWRTREAGSPIDATSQLIDGTHVDGAASLREALLKRPEVLVSTITEKLMTYALGRGLEAYDMPAVRKIVREAARQDYRFSAIVSGIVASPPFQMRMKAMPSEPSATQAAAP
jgi:mono/diheme cytochrome c family protein